MKLIGICFVLLFINGCGVKSDVVPPEKSWIIFEPSTGQNIQSKKESSPASSALTKEENKDESETKKNAK